MFARLERLVKSVVSDAVDAQVSFDHRASLGEDDDLRYERHCDHITIQFRGQASRLSRVLTVQQPKPATISSCNVSVRPVAIRRYDSRYTV